MQREYWLQELEDRRRGEDCQVLIARAWDLASEDIGNANPKRFAFSYQIVFERLKFWCILKSQEIILSQCVTYLAK